MNDREVLLELVQRCADGLATADEVPPDDRLQWLDDLNCPRRCSGTAQAVR